MELLADGLLIVTALTAGLYCMVLNRRLRRLTDSRGGIGPQIDSLDQALAETRSALEETRKGVSELQGSTSMAIAELTRETARGDDVARRIEGGVADAKATLQRLYEAEGRTASGARQFAEAADHEKTDPVIVDEMGEQATGATDDETTSTKVALPEGDIVELKESEIEISSPTPKTPGPSKDLQVKADSNTDDTPLSPVIKAERVVL